MTGANGIQAGSEPQPAQLGPQLVITWKPGGVEVSGPIQDKVLCYGMLEAAHDAIAEWHRAQGVKKNPLVLPEFRWPKGKESR